MYFIDAILTDEQRAALAAADVSFEELTLGNRAVHRHGITVSHRDLPHTLETLRLLEDISARHTYVRDPATNMSVEDYEYVPCIEMPTSENPVVIYPEIRGGSTLRPMLETLSREAGLGVLYRDTNRGESTVACISGLIQIKPRSVPPETAVYDSWAYINQIGDTYSLESVPAGYTPLYGMSPTDPVALCIGDDTTGYVVFLLFSPSESDAAITQFEYVLHCLARSIQHTLGGLQDFEAFSRGVARRRYLAGARSRLATEMASAQNSSQIETELREAQRTMTQALAAQQAWERQQLLLQTTPEADLLAELVGRMESEFDNLLNNPDFTSIRFGQSMVEVETVPIEIEHEGTIYLMGRYSITVSSSRNVRMHSLDHNGDRDHPHLSNGEPCYGNISETVSELLAQNNYGDLLPLLVEFLRSYYPSGAYSIITSFNVPTRPVSAAPAEPSAV